MPTRRRACSTSMISRRCSPRVRAGRRVRSPTASSSPRSTEEARSRATTSRSWCCASVTPELRRRRHETSGAGTIATVRDLETLTAADFAALRGNRFRIAPDDATSFEVELIDVTEIAREPGGRAPFSLVFQGGPSPPLAQHIYRVEHDALGAIEIFLVPIAADRYEAVF